MPDGPDPELIALGVAVRKLRVDRGLTQEKLAEGAELHTNYISDLERGHRNISHKSVVRLARALGVSLSGLMEEVERQREAEGLLTSGRHA